MATNCAHITANDSQCGAYAVASSGKGEHPHG